MVIVAAWERLLAAPEWIIVTGAVVAAVGVIWRKAVLPVVHFFQRVRQFMDRTETAVTWVEQQMRNNGGSSLVDKVDELVQNVTMLLDHDAERDTYGRRYGPDKEEGDNP